MDPTEATRPRFDAASVEQQTGVWQILFHGFIWLVLAWVLALPGSLHLRQRLLGDPRVDVWNHAWGFGWVADSLSNGALPWHTTLVGAPEGGVLYFIDLAGAVCAAPATLLAGPAVGYNLTLLVRVALAGFAGQRLSARLSGDGPWTWVGGVGCMSLPFLFAELGNGISEVTGFAWVLLALVAAARATDTGRVRDAALTGVLVGWSAAVSFYYGFLAAVLCGVWLVGGSVAHRRTRSMASLARQGAAVLGGAVSLGVPPWLAFRASLQAPGALVRRPDSLNLALLEHNAVDPRVFVAPGNFQSVDLATVYGEPFVHTAYLRWSVLVLVALALAQAPTRRRLFAWLGIAVLSLLMGMGDYLWWGGHWVRLGDNLLSLPFGWLKVLLPQVAITHPLRLSIGGQAVLAALAAGGARWVCTQTRHPRACAAGLALLVAAEGAFGSAAAWPLPTSDARVPTVYTSLDAGPVLDLPVEAGTTMQTSRWFWFQTTHGQPVPWTPDVRLGSARDTTLFGALSVPGRQPLVEHPHPLDAGTVAALRATYGTVVLHRALAQTLGLGDYEQILTTAFGDPEVHTDPAGGELWVWRL